MSTAWVVTVSQNLLDPEVAEFQWDLEPSSICWGVRSMTFSLSCSECGEKYLCIESI